MKKRVYKSYDGWRVAGFVGLFDGNLKHQDDTRGFR